MSAGFRNSTRKFAANYLLNVKVMNDLLATIFFLTHHPDVNKILLDYAITQTLVKRRDTSNDVVNPIDVNKHMYNIQISSFNLFYMQVDNVFFKKKNEPSGDYQFAPRYKPNYAGGIGIGRGTYTDDHVKENLREALK